MAKAMEFVKSVVNVGVGLILGIFAGVIGGIFLGLSIAKMMGVI